LNTGLWKHWLRIIGTFVIFGTSLIAKRVEAAECAGADLVVQHAHIITMDSFRRMAAALAVRGGTIVAVGSDPEIARCIEAHTKVLDLAGRTVLPGLIDVHTHAILWAEGVLRNEIDLTYPDVKTIPDVIAAVQKRAASVSPASAFKGSAGMMRSSPNTATLLDRIWMQSRPTTPCTWNTSPGIWAWPTEQPSKSRALRLTPRIRWRD
jgi:hypothetical protein